MIRTLSLSGLAILALSLTVAAQEKGYKTPQEVFDAFTIANDKKDAKTLVACLAPDARRAMAGDLAYESLEMRSQSGKIKQLVARLEPLFQALDKHGLTEKATATVKLGVKGKEKEKARQKLARDIKNHGAFLQDALSAMFKLVPETGEPPAVKLTDVKIDGDKARGVVITQAKGKETKNPVAFVKDAGGWKIIPEPEKVEKTDKDK